MFCEEIEGHRKSVGRGVHSCRSQSPAQKGVHKWAHVGSERKRPLTTFVQSVLHPTICPCLLRPCSPSLPRAQNSPTLGGFRTRTHDAHEVLPFAEQLLRTLVALCKSRLLRAVDVDGLIVYRVHHPSHLLESFVWQLIGKIQPERRGDRRLDVRPELEVRGKAV